MLMPSIPVLLIACAVFAVLSAINWYVSRPAVLRPLPPRTQASKAENDSEYGPRKAA
jgi:hypothetical protein